MRTAIAVFASTPFNGIQGWRGSIWKIFSRDCIRNEWQWQSTFPASRVPGFDSIHLSHSGQAAIFLRCSWTDIHGLYIVFEIFFWVTGSCHELQNWVFAVVMSLKHFYSLISPWKFKGILSTRHSYLYGLIFIQVVTLGSSAAEYFLPWRKAEEAFGKLHGNERWMPNNNKASSHGTL